MADRSFCVREVARVGGVEAAERGQVGARRIVRDRARLIDALGAGELRRARDRVERQVRRRAVEVLRRRIGLVVADRVVVRVDALRAAHDDVGVLLAALVRPHRQHHLAPAVGPAIGRLEERVARAVGEAERARRAGDVGGVDVVAGGIFDPHGDLQMRRRLEVDRDEAAAGVGGDARGGARASRRRWRRGRARASSRRAGGARRRPRRRRRSGATARARRRAAARRRRWRWRRAATARSSRRRRGARADWSEARDRAPCAARRAPWPSACRRRRWR